jgi:dihydroorotate dehydrogenase
MGLDFPNPVGLAAGLDKNGEHIDALAALGFGFIESAPSRRARSRETPAADVPHSGAAGDHQSHGLQQRRRRQVAGQRRRGAGSRASGGVLGINIGKNFDTPIERAADDYLICLERVYAAASYVAVNISSPNTKNLRELQQDDALDALLGSLKAAQARLADRTAATCRWR